MTAEVVIINLEAVALAADSAVTIGTSVDPSGQKVFASANKIYALSDFHPIGLMVFGNASYMGFPWETVVKTYRSELSRQTFQSVEEYARQLVQFLASDRRFSSSQAQSDEARRRLSAAYRLIVSRIQEAIDDRISASGPIRRTSIAPIVRRVIRSIRNQYRTHERLVKLTMQEQLDLLGNYRAEIDAASRQAFQKIPLDAQATADLDDIGLSLFTRWHTFEGDGSSGLVVAGFGDDEMLPAVVTYQVHGVVGDILRAHLDDVHTAGVDGPAIIGLAQREMVVRFMEGVDPDYQAFIDGLLSSLISEMPSVVLDQVPRLSAARRAAAEAVVAANHSQVMQAITERLKAVRQLAFVRPIVQVVAVLPKDELAAMAEALVNLTSFKRRVSMDLETVGGPIDVAVISRSDGLVWIKRKQYFEERLNPGYMRRRFGHAATTT